MRLLSIARSCRQIIRTKSECLGRALLGQGRIDEAIQVLATADSPGYLGYAYARAGRRVEAEELATAKAQNKFNEH